MKERGAEPLNMQIASQCAWMLQGTVGVNFYEKCEWDFGFLIAKQSISYVYRKPFSVGTVGASIVGQPGSFTVETFKDEQNLALPTADFFFHWHKGYFLGINYQGEFGSGYRSNAVTGKAGINF